ncbi:hypothetical protein [Defluviimonas sp. SAOS-178_SWC]|uniref:hypothetical protein n=1 Tax=Defluviimonas sp. SAOS-178_SWC TaxID=3121287 RepID=UPI0032220ED4
MAGRRADVVAFVEGYFGRPISGAAASDVLAATGCEGDDAFEFLQAFAEHFGVDLAGYRWEFHHADEGALLNSGWPFRPPHRKVARIPVTLDILVQAASGGGLAGCLSACRPGPATP